jgi:hypothetical protein
MPQKPSVALQCPQCEKPFLVAPCLATTRKFCSKVCADDASRLRRGNLAGGWRGGLVERSCVCGATFYATPADVRRGYAKVCSLNCRYKHVAAARRKLVKAPRKVKVARPNPTVAEAKAPWWTTAPRENFTATAGAEVERMKLPTFGQTKSSILSDV